MTHPDPDMDLGTKAGRKAYRHAVRMVAVRPRRYGLWLLAVGMMLIVMPSALDVHSLMGWSPRFLGLSACLAALPLLVMAAVLRARYRRGLRGSFER